MLLRRPCLDKPGQYEMAVQLRYDREMLVDTVRCIAACLECVVGEKTCEQAFIVILLTNWCDDGQERGAALADPDECFVHGAAGTPCR